MKKRFQLFAFYRILSNFATNLLGVFVPLLIFNATGKLYLAIIYWMIERIVRILAVYLLKYFIRQKPQLAILLRIIPLAITYILIICLNTSNAIILGIFIEISLGIANSLKTIPQDIIFNYIDSKTTIPTGLMRSIDRVGIVLSILLGGLMLEYLGQIYVAILALVFYAIASLPIYLNYIKSRHNSSYNVEYTSNATAYLKEQKESSVYYQKTKRSVLLGYTLLHFFISTMDQTVTILNLYLFASHQSYLSAGIYSSLYELCYGVTAYIVSIYSKSHNPSSIMTAGCILSGILCTFLPYTKSIYLLGLYCALLGVCMAAIASIEFRQELEKTRIIGCSNDVIYQREYIGLTGQSFVTVFGVFGFGLLPCFFVMSICGIVSGVYYNVNEENCRKKIVDFIHQNDII